MDVHSREALGDVERHVFNPVNYFLMAKRFTIEWQQTIERYFAPAAQTTQRTTDIICSRRNRPNQFYF